MSDAAFRVGLVGLAVAAGALVVRVGFLRPIVLPEIPPRPTPRRVAVAAAAAAAPASVAVDPNPSAYAEQLANDSRALAIDPVVTPADLSAAFPYRSDAKRRVLEPRRRHASTQVLGLALSLRVAEIEGNPRRNLILTIENTTGEHLAYRVVTQPSRGMESCYGKSDLAHNAIALAPGEKARRSECVYRKGLKLFVERVETIRVPRLSYYYVSALPAAAIGLDRLDRLAARGHRPAPGRSACRVFHSAELGAALARDSASWRDLIDFYARHPCGVYTFTIDYKAFERDQERPLPVVSAGF